VQIPPGFRVVAERSAFELEVAELVRAIPPGTVASYGRIADWLGRAASARAVGGALARSGGDTPAHRVVNAAGRLAPGWEREQAELLRVEGVRVRGGRVTDPIPWWDGPRTRPARSTG
jgi:alkylated DNA nucleotide flippase Atl1